MMKILLEMMVTNFLLLLNLEIPHSQILRSHVTAKFFSFIMRPY